MAAGIILMDLIWAAGLFGLGYLSAFSALAVHGLIAGKPALAITLALVTALLTWIFACTAVLFVLPKPKPGKYRLMRGSTFYWWALGFIARRWLDLPPMGLLYRQSGVLRFIVMRAAGAKVAFTAQMSSDALVLDPSLLTMGPNTMLGSQTTVAGHFILGDRLILAPVVIHRGAQVASDVVIGPGATIGVNAVIMARSSISPDTIVGDDAVVGACVTLGPGVVIGKGARIPMASVIPAKSQVPAGGTWPSPPAQDTAP